MLKASYSKQKRRQNIRSSFGGNLHLLQHLVEEKTLEENPLDFGLDIDKS